ncbi:MAG: hypothetical protein ACREP2_14420 [Rhodanobacteraceae bacterium]
MEPTRKVTQGPRRKRTKVKRSERGLALLMTILVLSSLLILGISLSTAVQADFQEAVFYRSYNEAEIRAQEGMANAMGFLMYDVWGVNEAKPFVCSQWTPGGAGDHDTHMQLGDTTIADGGGNSYAFEYDSKPLLASELQLNRVVYPGVPMNRFGAVEHVNLVSDWEWVNAKVNPNIMVNQWENYGLPTAGESRFTDGFLPTSSDVNDWFENGLHFNRTDLDGYWRNNFPNRPTDLYAGGSYNGWGHDRNGSPIGYTYQDYHGTTGNSYPFAAGDALNGDPIVTAPWNFVNTNTMVGDSFTRVFRSDLVDTNYQTATYGALCMGPQVAAANGQMYGGAININEVNNNYELEQYPGVLTPNDTTHFPVGSADYNATNQIEATDGDDSGEDFYYSGRSYHYNEAKWIYTYDEMGHPTGRYAVTILPDGGLPNVNCLGNPRYWSYHGFFPVGNGNPGIFPAFDRGYDLYGQPLDARASYGTGSNTAPGGAFAASNTSAGTWRVWGDQSGMNQIKNTSLNNIRMPGNPADVFNNATTNTVYWNDFGAIDGETRSTSSTNMGAYDAALSSTEFAAGTAELKNPKFAYSSPASLYAGPNQDVGDLQYWGQGITGHVFWHILDFGPIRTRAEFMMLLKKKAFMLDDTNYNGMAANGMDELPRGNGTWGDNEDLAVAEQDCQFLAGWLTPIGYDYTLDRLWNNDRVIIDSTGDLFMGENPDQKTNQYFWSGIASQTRNAGDPQSGYEGPCPQQPQDDDQTMSTPGRAPALVAGEYKHIFDARFRMVKGKSGAIALLTQLAHLHYLGNGLGVKLGGLTPYSPLAYRTDSAGTVIGLGVGAESTRRANAAGALALSFLLSAIRLPNEDYEDNWKSEYRMGPAAGVVVNWSNSAGTLTPDITIWQNMNWRQAWEVSSKAEWDYWTSKNSNVAPTYGSFQLHQYMRSTVTEMGRARVYPPYYLNDTDQDGKIGTSFGSSNGNDFRKPLVYNNDQRLFLPQYTEIPYDQWMTHIPQYAYDAAGIGLRQTWANYQFTIAGNPTVQTDVNSNVIDSLVGIQPTLMPNATDYLVTIRTTTPIPVHPNDQVLISGAGVFSGARSVISVVAPNAFTIGMLKADIGASTGPSGGGTVDLKMDDDPNLPSSATGLVNSSTDYAYPQGLPLVMNYIELCWPIARSNTSTNTYNNEVAESMSNHTWRQEYTAKDFFRMWVTDYNVNNPAGWTNMCDGTYSSDYNAAYNSLSGSSGKPTSGAQGTIRLDAGYGNSQPFFYVKGRLMEPDPTEPAGGLTQWYKQATPGILHVDASGTHYGIPLLIDMFDQFDPVHFGVSVREADAGGTLQWVNYNTTEFEQRAVQRVFGKLVDMTWGIGRDRIPYNAGKTGNYSANGVDEGYRWTTRTGNRGMFIRATTPMLMQRGITLTSPNWSGASGAKAFPFENFSIDMPVTLAFRQSIEKHTKMWGQNGPQYGSAPGDDASRYTGANNNLGVYLNSFSWPTYNRTYGQDCDWQAFYWWNEDGHAGGQAWQAGVAGSPTIAWDSSGRSPILPWDPNVDRSIDGHHYPYEKAGSDTSNYGLFSPTAGNAPMQAMTQGHPEEFKVIYFHPYFFPEKIVYGSRFRGSPQYITNQDRYYDYFWPTYTTDNLTQGSPTEEYGRDVITNISRNAGTVTVTMKNDLSSFLNPGAPMPAEPLLWSCDTANIAAKGDYIRVEGCADGSFNGVYQVVSNVGNVVTYQQDTGLPNATLPGVPGLNAGGNEQSQPAGFICKDNPFARIFDGGMYMSNVNPGGSPSWASYMGAPALNTVVNPAPPAPIPSFGDNNMDDSWVRFINMSTETWSTNCDGYFPVDRQSWDLWTTGTNANAQSPEELIEKVRGVITFPDYLGVGDLPGPGPAGVLTPHSLLWTKGPWWVDGDEGQGPVLMSPIAGLVNGDYIVDTTSQAHGRVVTTTGGRSGTMMVVQPCEPYAGGFKAGDSISKITYNLGASPFESDTVEGPVVNPSGQRLWIDYGRYCQQTTNPTNDVTGMNPVDWGNVDTVPTTGSWAGLPTGPMGGAPPELTNKYLDNVLEFSVSTPWVLDNGPSSMWQYNSAYCFKDNNPLHPDVIWTAGASSRVDPAFGNVHWYLAKGTDHECQVFSLPTPGERNTDHVAWGASPDQMDEFGNGIMPDPVRTGTSATNPGFNEDNGMAAGSPVSQYVESKLELALYQIGNVTDSNFKNFFYCTPIGHESADDVDFHELNWWDLSNSTGLDSIWELGDLNQANDSDSTNGWGYPPCSQWLGKDPIAVPPAAMNNDPGAMPIADASKGLDISQNYFTTNSLVDYIDNQNQGIREILTQNPMRPLDDTVGRTLGHYNMDRETTFKINPNLIASPMLYMWLQGGYIGQAQPTYVFGNKPALGYVSVGNMVQYCGTGYSDYHLTNWNSRVWYKHQMIAPSSFNDTFGSTYVESGYARMSNMLTFTPAPVYTAMITGQAIDDSGDPIAQIRLTVGIERTYDGKCNILEYQINTSLEGVK